MQLDEQDLKKGLKFIVGTWEVDYVVNAWSNDLAHIPAAEFKSEDGNDLSAISYTFFEDHTMVMKNAANGREVSGTWEQTGWAEYHYTLEDFLNLPDGNFRKGAETLNQRDGDWLVFSLGFLAVAMKKTAEGTVTEEPDIGDIEMSEEDAANMAIVGKYAAAQTMGVIGDDFGIYPVEKLIEALDARKAAGEIDEHEYEQSLMGTKLVVEFTSGHKVIQWMPLPPGVSEAEIMAALEAGAIADFNGEAFAKAKQPWKCVNGKFYYDTGEHREVFGEVQSSWDEVKFDEDGLMDFGYMKLRKIEE